MNKTKPTKRHLASFKINLDLGVYVTGDSLEQSLEKARTLKVTDIIDLSNLEYNDGEIEVTGIYQS